jgi:hypothetical protein
VEEGRSRLLDSVEAAVVALVEADAALAEEAMLWEMLCGLGVV